MFTKENQAKLKERYIEAIRKIYNTEDMVDYCVKQVFLYIETSAGKICTIEKGYLEKSYCVSYDEHISGSIEDAYASIRGEDKKRAMFIEANLAPLRRSTDMINSYEDCIITQEYCTVGNDTIVRLSGPYSDFDKREKLNDCKYYYKAEVDEVTADRYKEALALYEKYKMNKINAYLKRYGVEKCRFWTYSCND